MSRKSGKAVLTVLTSAAALLLTSQLAFAADAIPVGGESYIKVIFAVGAMIGGRLADAARLMNRETALRRELTPEVLDGMGEALVDMAIAHRCGARFAGAGGGGCLWALGEGEAIRRLRPAWEELLGRRAGAVLLPAGIAARGVVCEDRDD